MKAWRVACTQLPQRASVRDFKKNMEAALVAAAERNDADAVERIQRAARGDDDALCDALASHLRTELEREAPPPPLDNANDFPALPTTKKKRVRATLVTATVPPAPRARRRRRGRRVGRRRGAGPLDGRLSLIHI